MYSIFALFTIGIMYTEGVVILTDHWGGSSDWTLGNGNFGSVEYNNNSMLLRVNPRDRQIFIHRTISLNKKYKNVGVTFEGRHGNQYGSSQFQWRCDGSNSQTFSISTSVSSRLYNRILTGCHGAESLTVWFICRSTTVQTALSIGSELTIYGDEITDEPTGSPTAMTQSPTQMTISPTIAPTKERCSDERDYNLMFIIDESESVGIINYKLSIDFIIDLIKYDVNNMAKLAVLSFGSDNDVVYTFSDQQNDDRAAIIDALENEKNDYSDSQTFTYNALKEGLQQFQNDTNDNENNLLLLVTDGSPTPQNTVCGYDDDQYDLLRQYKKHNIRVIIIGITSNFIKTKLDCIAYNGDIFEIENFGSEQFKKIENELRNILCPNKCDMISSALSIPYTDNYDKFKLNNDYKNNNNNNNHHTLIALFVGALIINIIIVCCYILYKYLNGSTTGYFKPKYQYQQQQQQQQQDEENVNLK